MSSTNTLGQTAALIISLPFEAARANYARAVRLGLIEHSLLKSARFARELGAIERLILGPWARRV